MSEIEKLIQQAQEFYSAGKYKEAEHSFERVLVDAPANLPSLFYLGTLKFKSGDYKNAKKLLDQTVKLKPDFPEAFNNLGNVCLVTGEFNDAVTNYDKALSFKLDIPETFNNRGVAFRKLHRLPEAIVSFKKAIELRNDYVEAYNNLGAAFKDSGEFNAAALSIRQALALRPDHAEAHNNLGVVLKAQGRFSESESSFHRALSIKPDYAEAYNNLGNLYRDMWQYKDSAKSYARALELKPGYVEAYNNNGIALRDQGRIEEALLNYDKALEVSPGNVEVGWNKSLALLLKGDYSQGWQWYETRLSRGQKNQRVFSKPRFEEMTSNAEKVFVYAEQGFGDTIQFVRFLPALKKLCKKVIFECQPGLVSLLKNCEGVDEIVPKSDNSINTHEFDAHIPLMSLPRLFKVTPESLPAKLPYIRPDKELIEKWRIYLNLLLEVDESREDDNNLFKIGLVWSGNPTHENDRNRSCPLEHFIPLGKLNNVVFISLQKNQATSQILELPDGIRVIDLDKDLKEFVDTAAAISNLDLVISVDTAVAHLAAALVKPTWTLLPFAPDWRWLLNRKDSPWYPGMRLFRQPKFGDWESVFKCVEEELKKLI